MKPLVVLITGIAPHSLGEALVHLASRRSMKLICIDIEPNAWLRQHASYYPITLDLNPIGSGTTYGGFLRQLRNELQTAVETLNVPSIDCVVQCAGVYRSGAVVSHGEDVRRALIGVNLLGHVEVLSTVMQLNKARGAKNGQSLLHLDIGSLHGLQARPGRAIYSCSKAAGIEFAAAVLAGNEVARSVYVAAGPLDTYMLHRNHWVTRVKGPEDFLVKLKAGNRDKYRAILIDCSRSDFDEAAKTETQNAAGLGRVFDAYVEQRTTAQNDRFGIVGPHECAEFILDLIVQPASKSGVYLAVRKHERLVTGHLSFEQMDRLSLAEHLLGW